MGIFIIAFLLVQVIPEQVSLTEDHFDKAIILGLLPILVAFSFIVFVIYRSKREAEFKEKETVLRLKSAEGELKALKAQINPHFIFNCLNSIHHYIQSNDSKSAGIYLIKFSQLVRYVLESTSKNWVSLEEELETNRNYLELEQMRNNGAFSFDFVCAGSISPSEIFIPPMLIQPFLENAVWHGVSKNGHILLSLAILNDTYLECKVENKGQAIDEKMPYDLSNLIKKSSMGLQLMRDRFESLNALRGFQSGFEFGEAVSGSKVVTLKFPYLCE
ncbi:Histidine kinase [Algoriphagus locisalis]|uniref:Histidine kinase n=1 Tax=Algoriphagus locisalis TaxID=305507 RepID=A0A1I6XRM6_9BACT|nr:histidine kinase [Algoriphagus locisalis]SFT41135.1 Histidine kinase [Algoriphagus locisalis]